MGKISFLLITILLSLNLSGQRSTIVYDDGTGKLVYKADAKGNTVPDFSGVGYQNSEENIPDNIPVVKTVEAVQGDNLQIIQNAINEVSALTPGTDGFRGAILFKKGEYRISNTINVKAGGIVLMGEGAGTVGTCFVATGTTQFNLINIAGTSGVTSNEATIKKVTDAYVPYGTDHVTVEEGHSFQTGEWVYFRRVPNQAWIDLLNTAQYGWTPAGYKVNYERKIVKVEGNTLYFDAPVVDYIDPVYASAYVVKISSSRIEKCGIENIRFISLFASSEDENHGWIAVFFDKIVNGWARNLEAYYFGYAAVSLGEQTRWVTVDNCKMIDPMSQTTGGRKYSFNVDGQRNLVKNCVTRGGRHDYVNGSCTAGPNVFFNNSSTMTHADIGPHHRWSTGILFDNIRSDGSMNVQNRTNSGSGHGWAGSQIMFWNSTASEMIVQDTPADHTNWAIGCTGKITNIGDWVTAPLGIVESKDVPVVPYSLFEAQLQNRLGSKTPEKPVCLTAKAVSFSEISLNWVDESFNEQQFHIEVSTDKGLTWSFLSNVTGNTRSFIHKGISDTLTRYYRVRAENTAGNSDYSNIASATCRIDPLPLPWQNQDLGSPIVAGNAGFVNGTFVINGSGTDIYGTSDQFHFVYQTLSGDGEITARVTSITNTNTWAKAGVMIRTSLESNAPNAFMLVSANSGTQFQYRTMTGGSTFSAKQSGVAPVWLKMIRKGNSLTGYQSSEGTFWTQVGTTTVSTGSNVFIGLAVSSHVSGTICNASFENVSVITSPYTGVEDARIHDEQLNVYPNPVNKQSFVRYRLLKPGRVYINLIGENGKTLKELVNKYCQKGEYQISFEPAGLPSGVYIMQMKSENSIISKKVLVINI